MLISPKRVKVAAIEAGTWRKCVLDDMLTTEEADIFELFHNCELLLMGNARGVDYSGDRVQGNRTQMNPFRDKDFHNLANHARLKKRLPRDVLAVLRVACAQQRGDDGAPSDAQAGLAVDKRARNAARAWRRCVVAAIKVLAGIGTPDGRV